MDKENNTEVKPYIFSEAFYNNDFNNMSKFEQEVYKYINKKPLNKTVLMEYYQNIGNLSVKEQFYHIPILYLMLKETISNMKTEI